jgi:sulfur-oxidizing protein SoxB
LSDVKLREARDLAENVTGVNLIFADDVPLPEAVRIGATRIITSCAQGRFVTRFDFDMVEGKVTEVEQRLIPMFAEIMPAEPQMVMRIKTLRAPFLAVLSEPIGRAGVLLYQASAVRSTWDDLICNALRAELRFGLLRGRGGPCWRAKQ